MTRPPYFLYGLLTGLLIMLFGLILLKMSEQDDQPKSKSGYSCKGKLGEKCPVDTVTYDQHPDHKLRNTWQNR